MYEMFRHRNTNAEGKPFPSAVVKAVWEKAASSPGHGPMKADAFGSLMWEPAFGNVNSKLGWEIRHLVPVETGGTDDLENLEAIQWENHRRLEGDRPGTAATPLRGNIVAAPQIPKAPPPNQPDTTGATLIPADILKAAAML